MISQKSIRFNPWREMSILMLIIMETSWVTPWFRSLTSATYAVNAIKAFVVLFCIVLISHIVVRFMEFLRLKTTIRRGITIALLVIVIFGGLKILLYAQEYISFIELINRPLRSFLDWRSLIPDEFVIILVILIGWWRGIAIAQEHIGPSSVSTHFGIGIVLFMVFIFVNTLVTGETPGDFFYLFLFSSLLAMISARMAVLGTLRGGRQNAFDRRWFLGIILASTMVVGLSALAGGVIGEQFAWVGYILLGLFGSILVFIWIVLSPILSWLINLIINLAGNSRALESLDEGFQKINDIMRGLGQRITDMIDKTGIAGLLSRWGPTIKTIILVGVILVVVTGIVLFIAIQIWKDRERRRLDEEQKSILTSVNIWQMLQAMLKRGRDGIMKTLGNLTDFRRRQRLRAAARIRQIYAELMDLCENLDQPRAEAQTPLEFIPSLARLFPEFGREVEVITQSYLLVRYGQLPETRKEVEEVENAWKRIRSRGDELYKDLKSKKKILRPVDKRITHEPHNNT